MTEELWLAAWMRQWAERVLPGEHGVAEEAAVLAMRAYAAGASFAEAGARGQHFLARHVRDRSRQVARTRPAATRRPRSPELIRPRATGRVADRSR